MPARQRCLAVLLRRVRSTARKRRIAAVGGRMLIAARDRRCAMRTILTFFAIASLLAILALPAQASVAAGDFDGDGRSDVFWRNSSTGANAIWKSANVATRQSVASVSNLHWAIVGQGDFDGDGRVDVFWRNSDTGANVIWKSGNAATRQAAVGVTRMDWQ